ncbi:pyridoxamine 5'-phosphate oxidase family protein [Nonomuraea sp. NPDC050691]|uniref:pyridoxamine 5'-phosphate oxidase family protein n=1 Tax=Nonomuraea sp. NPDC050691 TaxID=3155661 RepID=UPI0033FE838D
MADVYHAGEHLVQARAGLLEQARSASRTIRGQIPGVAREFLEQQVTLVIGAADDRGRVWASLLTGPRGFIKVSGSAAIDVAALPSPGDPLHARLTAPAGAPFQVGMIAIEPATRRRMRMNGRARPAPGGFRVELDQVYSNCPKYLTKRHPVPAGQPVEPGPVTTAGHLSEAQRALISRADTFFVATADREGDADASHRGGNPGFVEVTSPTTLRWPDYRGNAMFCTLGNIEASPAAGLIFPDWQTGGCLQLTGVAATDWDPGHAAAVPGAERMVEFTVHHVVEITGASPLRWTGAEYSRFNPPASARERLLDAGYQA